MSGRRFLALALKGAVWFFAARVGSAVALLAINVLLARTLSIRDFAAFALVVSVVTIMGSVTSIGFGTAATRAIAQGRATGASATIRRGALLALLFALAASGVAALACFVWPVPPLLLERVFGRPLGGLEQGLLVLWLVSFAARNIGGYVYRGLRLQAQAAFYQGTGANIAALVLLAGALQLGWTSLETALAAMSLAAILVAATCWAGVIVHLARLPRDPLPADLPASTFVRLGGFLALPTLFQTNGREICLWIVSATSPVPEVALYGAANRLLQVVALPVVVTNQVLQPFIAEFSATGDLARQARALRLSTAIVFAVMAGLVLGILVFGERILSLVFRPEFAAANTILLWLAMGRLIQAFFGPTFAVLSMTGHERMLARDSVLQFALLAGLGLLGGWLLGGLGVAIAYCVALASFAAWRTFTVQRRLGIWLLPELDPRAMLDLARQALRRRGRRRERPETPPAIDIEGAS